VTANVRVEDYNLNVQLERLDRSAIANYEPYRLTIFYFFIIKKDNDWTTLEMLRVNFGVSEMTGFCFYNQFSLSSSLPYLLITCLQKVRTDHIWRFSCSS